MKHSWSLAAATVLTAMFMAGTAHAIPNVTVSATAGSPFDTAAVTEAVNGNEMHGMTVTACLVSGACETRTWIGDGGTGGGASGTNWSLALDGDSYNNKFIFAGGGGWKSLAINTRGGLATFDWIAPTEESPGSFLGIPFKLDVFDSGGVPDPQFAISAEYSDVLFVGGQVYNDLYTVLTINITHSTGQGFTGSMEFFADTDKTLAISPVPEPATLVTMGLGLAFLAALRRRAVART